MNKTAIVLAGGGSRGAYQIGVWKALREMGIDYQLVTGTSVGALNGVLMVQQEYDKALAVWENISSTAGAGGYAGRERGFGRPRTAQGVCKGSTDQGRSGYFPAGELRCLLAG